MESRAIEKEIIIMKDYWDKIQALGAAMMPVSVAIIGLLGSNYLATKQAEDTKARFYAELISKREEADSSLRKDMFNTIMANYLKFKSTNDLSQKVLALELIASNFHESFDLRPIFNNIYKEISSEPDSKMKEGLVKRLLGIVGEIKDKQILALTGTEKGQKLDGYLQDIISIKKDLKAVKMIDESLELPENENSDARMIKAHVVVWANSVNIRRGEIRVRLEIQSADGTTTYADNVFWIGLFDLPMLDNTMLKNGQRCAIALTKFERESSAEVTLVIFPSSRASLKDKPAVDEMLYKMVTDKKSDF